MLGSFEESRAGSFRFITSTLVDLKSIETLHCTNIDTMQLLDSLPSLSSLRKLILKMPLFNIPGDQWHRIGPVVRSDLQSSARILRSSFKISFRAVVLKATSGINFRTFVSRGSMKDCGRRMRGSFRTLGDWTFLAPPPSWDSIIISEKPRHQMVAAENKRITWFLIWTDRCWAGGTASDLFRSETAQDIICRIALSYLFPSSILILYNYYSQINS